MHIVHKINYAYKKDVHSPLQEAIKKVIVDKVKKQENNESTSEIKDIEK